MRTSNQTYMDPHAAAIEQIAMAIATLQDTVHGLDKRIDRQQSPQISTQEDAEFDMGAPPPPLSMDHMASLPIPQGTHFFIQRPTDVIPSHAIVPI